MLTFPSELVIDVTVSKSLMERENLVSVNTDPPSPPFLFLPLSLRLPYRDIHQDLGTGQEGVVVEVAVTWLAAHWLLHAQLSAVGQCRDRVVQWLHKDIAGWV